MIYRISLSNSKQKDVQASSLEQALQAALEGEPVDTIIIGISLLPDTEDDTDDESDTAA